MRMELHLERLELRASPLVRPLGLDAHTVKQDALDDAEELALTLTKLGQQLSASCTFDLGSAPEHPELLRVLLDDETVAEDDEDGWERSGEQALTLLGESCRAWLGGEVFRVRVLETCAGEAR